MRHSPAAVWAIIVGFVVFTSLGDVLLSKAMTLIGDLGSIRKAQGLGAAVGAVAGSLWFWSAIIALALSFFSLLTALSWADLSLVGPASSSLTFLFNTVAAKFFLKEKVDARRWMAVALVCAGIGLISR
jgi:drug/metabolite transporter (DMT)-like permease